MLYKTLVHIGFVVFYGLLLFFGIGPVLLADGPPVERTVTFIVVLIAAAALLSAQIWLTKRLR
jgi:hypothetical protein